MLMTTDVGVLLRQVLVLRAMSMLRKFQPCELYTCDHEPRSHIIESIHEEASGFSYQPRSLIVLTTWQRHNSWLFGLPRGASVHCRRGQSLGDFQVLIGFRTNLLFAHILGVRLR
jgi:hypothetical protein